MSREKECKCCHEWWYASVIKEDLCPNCYDYFKQLKQQLAEKDKEIAHLKEKDNYHLRYELAGADETITNLKQQLAEKDKEIKKLNWQLKDKDFTIKNLNHSLSVTPNANAGQRARIDELTKIVKEKDKEINSLIVDYEKRISQEQELMSNMEHRLTEKQNTIDEINKEFVQAVHDWKALCAEKDKKLLEFKKNKLYFELLITRLQWLHKKADDYRQEKERFGIADMSLSSVWDVLELQKNDLCEYEEMCALQEGIECIANSKLLADIEHDLEIKVTRNENEIFKDIELIDNQIKELKGEKDVED